MKLTEEINEYLNALRESGETNMFLASRYLEEAFDMDKLDARDALFAWMDSKKGDMK
jgi:hypothetical protein